MSINIRIIHAHEFIKATLEGQLDLDKVKRLLVEIASASGPSFHYEVIIDARKVQSELSIADLWYVVSDLSELHEAFSRKTAVLCPVERFHFGEFLALCAQNRGLQVNAFTSFEAAMEWLIEEEVDACR